MKMNLLQTKRPDADHTEPIFSCRASVLPACRSAAASSPPRLLAWRDRLKPLALSRFCSRSLCLALCIALLPAFALAESSPPFTLGPSEAISFDWTIRPNMDAVQQQIKKTAQAAASSDNAISASPKENELLTIMQGQAATYVVAFAALLNESKFHMLSSERMLQLSYYLGGKQQITCSAAISDDMYGITSNLFPNSKLLMQMEQVSQKDYDEDQFIRLVIENLDYDYISALYAAGKKLEQYFLDNAIARKVGGATLWTGDNEALIAIFSGIEPGFFEDPLIDAFWSYAVTSQENSATDNDILFIAPGAEERDSLFYRRQERTDVSNTLAWTKDGITLTIPTEFGGYTFLCLRPDAFSTATVDNWTDERLHISFDSLAEKYAFSYVTRPAKQTQEQTEPAYWQQMYGELRLNESPLMNVMNHYNDGLSGENMLDYYRVTSSDDAAELTFDKTIDGEIIRFMTLRFENVRAVPVPRISGEELTAYHLQGEGEQSLRGFQEDFLANGMPLLNQLVIGGLPLEARPLMVPLLGVLSVLRERISSLNASD